MSTQRTNGPGPRRITAAAIALFAALALVAWVGPAQAASFDCAKAATAVEKTICADAELSRLDEALGEAYAEARAQTAGPAALQSDQRAWLRDSRDACPDAACLKGAYEARIAALMKTADPAGNEIVRRDKYGNPFDAQGLPVGPAEISGRGQDAFSGFQIIEHFSRDKGLCEGLSRGLRQYGLVPRLICGVPIPANDPDFERVPPWRDLDPAGNMALVKELYFWSNVTTNVFSEADLSRQRSSKEIIPELFDRIWPDAEERVKALIAAGRIEIQVTRFDYDNDGEDETVYRMTRLISQGFGEPPLFALRQCKVAVPGWSDMPMQYMIERDGKRTDGGSYYSLFRYKGKTHIFNHGVGKTVRNNSWGTERMCLFQPIAEE